MLLHQDLARRLIPSPAAIRPPPRRSGPRAIQISRRVSAPTRPPCGWSACWRALGSSACLADAAMNRGFLTMWWW